MENFVIYSDVLKQYKDLTCKEEKLFFYAYHKMYIKVKAIMKELDIKSFDGFDFDKLDHWVQIKYEDIKMLCEVKRVDKNNYKDIKKKLVEGSCSIDIQEEKGIRTIFLYDEMFFDNEEKKIIVKFNKNIKHIFTLCEKLGFTKVFIRDLIENKKSYDLKLYLYACTILRNNKGNVNINMENLRNIINPKSNIPDKNFYSRFIKQPSDRINENKELRIKIETKREKELIKVKVYNK